MAHEREASLFATPTITGYQRFALHSFAPDRADWAHENRGAMVRVVGDPGDPASHAENRAGEPCANPYLFIASQITAGLDGLARSLEGAALPRRRRGQVPRQGERRAMLVDQGGTALAQDMAGPRLGAPVQEPRPARHCRGPAS
jgi:glutamine synthetase